MVSINTNISAMQALYGLDRANQQLGVAQKRVNTGYRVNDANDDGASFAVAQSVRGNINAYDAVMESLNRTKGELSKARQLFEQLGELVNQAIPLLAKLSDSSLNTQSRQAYSDEFTKLLDLSNDDSSIAARLMRDTTFMGQSIAYINPDDIIDIGISNIRGGKIGLQISAETNAATWGVTGTLRGDIGDSFSGFGGPIPAAIAASYLTDLSARNPMAQLATVFARYERRVDGLIKMNSTLRDAAEIGLGAMVDADLGRESAKLESAQIKQQMAIQSLGIANTSNRNLLALFGR